MCEALQIKGAAWLEKLVEAGADVNVTAHPNALNCHTPLHLALDWNLGVVKKNRECWSLC
jgi:hypothetical protein